MSNLLSQNEFARLALLGLVFVIVVALTFLSTTFLTERRLARQRLAVDAPHPGDIDQPRAGSLRGDAVEGAWARLVERIERSGLSLADSKDEALRQKLAAAGFSRSYAPRIYTLVRLALVVGLPVTIFVVMWLAGSRPSLVKLWFIAIVSALLGLYGPSLFIRAKADRRRTELINGFPDALDLMLVCVEAGLGLESAFARVGMEMTHSHPLIAEQLGTVVLELRAGRSREDALRRMADRAEVDEIRAFATLLIQSSKLGSSIAQTLRTYASEMREKRRMRAEEKAHRLPVLLSIPLVACMLPVMIGVLMLPAAIRILKVFGGH